VVTAAAFEEKHAELTLKVGQGLADDRLGATQPTARRGEAALLDGGDEGTELVERDTVEHVSS
jgi:hypothetical protein